MELLAPINMSELGKKIMGQFSATIPWMRA
jgi:hypothetical protein